MLQNRERVVDRDPRELESSKSIFCAFVGAVPPVGAKARIMAFGCEMYAELGPVPLQMLVLLPTTSLLGILTPVDETLNCVWAAVGGAAFAQIPRFSAVG